MEAESFEDEEVAALLNEHYVSIKVDREERPDIDHLYMTVCQAMTGQGGWPLTIIMTPTKKPFFAGTYFPKNKKFGRIGLMELLSQITTKWDEDAEGLMDTSDQILNEVEKRSLSNLEGEVSIEILDRAFHHYEQIFDPTYGGSGSAPKFPTSHNLSFLLRYYDRTGNKKTGHSMFLIALSLAYSSSSEVVLVGDKNSDTIKEMIKTVRKGFRPNTLSIFVLTREEGEEPQKLIPLVQDKNTIDGKPKEIHPRKNHNR
jgi:uncharacterized protein YyaL (SSP411 family)